MFFIACVSVSVHVHMCELTFVTSVCVFRVERVQQVDGAGRSGFAPVLLLMVC